MSQPHKSQGADPDGNPMPNQPTTLRGTPGPPEPHSGALGSQQPWEGDPPHMGGHGLLRASSRTPPSPPWNQRPVVPSTWPSPTGPLGGGHTRQAEAEEVQALFLPLQTETLNRGKLPPTLSLLGARNQASPQRRPNPTQPNPTTISLPQGVSEPRQLPPSAALSRGPPTPA